LVKEGLNETINLLCRTLFGRYRTRQIGKYQEGYGPAVAADTGGDIKGQRIDLYMESYEEAIQFGRRQVLVEVLKER